MRNSNLYELYVRKLTIFISPETKDQYTEIRAGALCREYLLQVPIIISPPASSAPLQLQKRGRHIFVRFMVLCVVIPTSSD
jgi:hypothetical protein